MGTATTRAIGAALLALAIGASAQTVGTGKTVRKTRVADDALSRAEAAIDKKDFTAAEEALQQSVKSDTANFRAWYDLGFVYSATNRQPEAIEAYRKSVAAKPDVFESNLNLGLILAQSGDASAERYLRAATTLKPASNANQNLARA